KDNRNSIRKEVLHLIKFVKKTVAIPLTSSVLFHTDQGSQYTSFEFRKFIEDHPIVHSLSKPDYPWDNAVTEAFFKYMKKEELNRRSFHSIEEVRLACFAYIEGFYNTKRPHGT
ncbi:MULTISPECIES: integrase core domain-containing protein, partial [Enterococcus]|nr:DDE-type integrase/transposase/recombinase [Enterococcus raffinosus]